MNVGVVTVTYGDRWHLLKQMLEAVLALPSAVQVIVVDNGSTASSAQKAVRFGGERIKAVELGGNKGSAEGFGKGIKRACEMGLEYIWLLDDDNIPEPDALDVLTGGYDKLVDDMTRDNLALQSMREGRKYLGQIARGDDPNRWYPIDNSFLGFHLKRALARLIARPSRLKDRPLEAVAIPFGVYGGLFFHRSVVDRIGVPKEDLFLYGDDNEFTLRLTRAGGVLYLVPSSRVHDAERSWRSANAANKTSLATRQAEASEAQLYYSTRNGAWFSREYYRRSPLVFALNKWLYLVRTVVGLLVKGRVDRVRLILKAIRDGERGRLGRLPEFGL